MRPLVGAGGTIERREAVVLGAAGLLMVIAPQLLGGITVGTGLAIAAATGLVAIVTAWILRRQIDGFSFSRDLGLRALLLVVAATILQLVPLPEDALAAVSEPFADQLERVRLATGSAATWRGLSWDPGATGLHLIYACAVAAAYVTGVNLAHAGFRRFVIGSVAASTAAMAVITLLHALFGLQSVYGLYVPRFADPPIMAPLLNPNNLGGFLALGIPIWIGLAWSRRAPAVRYGLLCVALMMVGVLALTLSRGAIAVAIGGIMVMMAVGWRRWKRSPLRLRGVLALLGLACVSIAIAWAALEPLVVEFQGSAAKLQQIGERFDLVWRAPWTGVGRGGFAAAAAAHSDGSARPYFAENFLLQWSVDLGIPLTIVLVGLLGRHVLRGVRESTTVVDHGAWVGLLSLLVHNLVDFGLELPGIAVVGAALFGAVSASGEVLRTERTKRRRSSPKLTLAVGAVTILLVCLLGPMSNRYELFSVQDRLIANLDAAEEDFWPDFEQAVALHPLEPAIFLIGGAYAVRHGDERSLSLLNRAMELAPGWAGPHVQAAWWLDRTGHREQALLELREAATREPAAVRELLCAILSREQNARVAIQVAPVDERFESTLLVATDCVDIEDDVRAELERHLMEREVSDPRPYFAVGTRHLNAGEIREAREVLDLLGRRAPGSRYARELHIQILRSEGDLDAALEEIREAERESTDIRDRRRFLELRAWVHTQREDHERLANAMAELKGLASGDVAQLAEAFRLQGRLQEELGKSGEALSAYRRAHGIRPLPRYLADAARIAEQIGEIGFALSAHEELCDEASPESLHCIARDRLLREAREAAVEGLSPSAD